MYKHVKRFLILIILFANVLLVVHEHLFAANYPLEIIAPQESLNLNSRYYKAYPGLEYKVPVGVFGGAYPFNYELLSAPSGMSIDSNTGVITWPNPTTSGSPHNVSVRVTDSESTIDSHSWTITVTTSGFIFVDAINGNSSGDGTINNPLQTINDVCGGTSYAAMNANTYDNYFMYFRAGTYDPSGYFNNSGQQYQIEWRNVKPHVWLAYPGETVIIDHDRTASGAFFDWSNSADSNDTFIHGIKFQDMLNHAFRISDNRITFFENTFSNLGPGCKGDNTSFIMFVSGGGSAEHYFTFIKDNTFNDINNNTGSHIKLYNNLYMVVEGNTFLEDAVGNTAGPEGLAIKATVTHIDVRGNTWDGRFEDGSISGNWNNCRDMEIRFNNIKNARSMMDYGGSGVYGAITLNYHGTAGPVQIYRNTFEGVVMLRRGYTGNGAFTFSNNVIVNEDSGYIPGSHITYFPEGGSVTDPTVVVISSDPNGNLVGNSADGIIDANGNLTSSYSSFLGTKGHQISGGGEPEPGPTLSSPQNLSIGVTP